jgi:hypothetical protein
MRLLGPLHTSFENVANYQSIYGLIVAVIDLHRAHLAIHAAGDAVDLNLQKRLCIDSEVPHLPRAVEPLWCNTLRSRDRLSYYRPTSGRSAVSSARWLRPSQLKPNDAVPLNAVGGISVCGRFNVSGF